MAIEYAMWRVGSWLRGTAPIDRTADAETYTHAHCVGGAVQTSVSAGSSAVALSELDCPLRAGGIYVFEYNLIYSISGLAVGAQFGVDMLSGGVDSVGYSVLMAADGSSLRSVATTTLGALIGSGSSFSGGGPWSCCITGALKLSTAANPVARLNFKGSGIGVNVTIQPNSTVFFQES